MFINKFNPLYKDTKDKQDEESPVCFVRVKSFRDCPLFQCTERPVRVPLHVIVKGVKKRFFSKMYMTFEHLPGEQFRLPHLGGNVWGGNIYVTVRGNFNYKYMLVRRKKVLIESQPFNYNEIKHGYFDEIKSRN